MIEIVEWMSAIALAPMALGLIERGVMRLMRGNDDRVAAMEASQ